MCEPISQELWVGMLMVHIKSNFRGQGNRKEPKISVFNEEREALVPAVLVFECALQLVFRNSTFLPQTWSTVCSFCYALNRVFDAVF